MTKYFRFHKSHGHITEECIHLKDVINILIRDMHLKKYTKKKEGAHDDAPKSKKVEEKKLSSYNMTPTYMSQYAFHGRRISQNHGATLNW